MKMSGITPIFCKTVNWTALYSVLQNLGFIIEIEQGMRTEMVSVNGKFCEETTFDASWDEEDIELIIYLKQDEDGIAIKEDIKKKLKRIGAVRVKSSATILNYNIPTKNLFTPPLQLILKTSYHRGRRF